MFNPKYRILLKKRCFPKDEVVCLGSQLISIINSVKDYLPSHVWYGSDVEAVRNISARLQLNDVQLKKIGTDLEFIEYCNEVDQFVWGVFLCIHSNFASQNIQGLELETEDKSFRSVNVNGSLMEIRAFDTSYFALYFEDLELSEKFSRLYHVEIEINES
jgi:hypothetical protein